MAFFFWIRSPNGSVDDVIMSCCPKELAHIECPHAAGLYTGEPFASAEWGNRPICPDAASLRDVLVSDTLGSGTEAGAAAQMVALPRVTGAKPPSDGYAVVDAALSMTFAPE